MTVWATTPRTVIVHVDSEHPINGGTVATLITLDGDENGNVVRLTQAENTLGFDREELAAVYKAAIDLLDNAERWVSNDKGCAS